MSKEGWILYVNINEEKCQTCMLNKITRNHFPSITKESLLFELIQSDLCNFHNTSYLRNKIYTITFINDFLRFCYLYMLHSNDKVMKNFKIFRLEIEL